MRGIDVSTENILAALIEVSGTFLVQKGIAMESYGEALRKMC